MSVFTVALMMITLISITYGALVCSVLAIQIRYDDYKVRLRFKAYLCMIVWRGLEIATRVTALVFFSTALTHWVILVGMANLLFFFFLPWAEFWAKKGSLTENVEKNFSKVGTTVVLCMFTLLYACINVFCWSAVQLDLSHRELIERKQRWDRLALYYFGRLFKHNIHDCLHCICCRRGGSRATGRRGKLPPSYSTAATMVLVPEEPLELLGSQNSHPPEGSEQETAIVEDMMEAA